MTDTTTSSAHAPGHLPAPLAHPLSPVTAGEYAAGRQILAAKGGRDPV